MIELKNVTKKYDDRVIIDDLSLTIKDGEFVVFSGPSGCGKTTLLHLIGTIEPASSGTILINGKDIRNRRNQEHGLKYDILLPSTNTPRLSLRPLCALSVAKQ